MGFPTCSPLRDQIPCVPVVSGLWFPLTPVSFDKVNTAAVADEYLKYSF